MDVFRWLYIFVALSCKGATVVKDFFLQRYCFGPWSFDQESVNRKWPLILCKCSVLVRTGVGWMNWFPFPHSLWRGFHDCDSSRSQFGWSSEAYSVSLTLTHTHTHRNTSVSLPLCSLCRCTVCHIVFCSLVIYWLMQFRETDRLGCRTLFV